MKKIKTVIISIIFIYSLSFSENITKIYDNLCPSVIGLRCQAVTRVSGRLQAGYFYGSGVIITKEGLALTNSTVIPGSAKSISVFLNDGRVISGKLIKVLPKLETSLIKLEGKDFKPVNLVDTKKVLMGMEVFSLGNPFHCIDQDSEVAISRGILSGIYKIKKKDNIDRESSYEGLLLETTASLNPGSDGGPLVDINGNLLGILSLALHKKRRLGAAIPIHLILEKFEKIKHLASKPPKFSSENPAVKMAKKAEEISKSIVIVKIKKQKKNRKKIRIYTKYSKGISILKGNYVLTTFDKDLKKKDLNILFKGKEIKASLKAYYMPYNIALLKPEKKLTSSINLTKNLKPVQLGDYIGIIGRFDHLENITLTTGIISAVDRFYMRNKVFQTQAFLNYSNIGTPVLNVDGSIIGLTCLKFRWNSNVGIGIFMDINKIIDVIPELKQGKNTGFKGMAYLGIKVSHNLLHLPGIPVESVDINSAAHKAGIKVGDLIISIDGKNMESFSEFIKLLNIKKPGDEVVIKIRRGKKEILSKAILTQLRQKRLI